MQLQRSVNGMKDLAEMYRRRSCKGDGLNCLRCFLFKEIRSSEDAAGFIRLLFAGISQSRRSSQSASLLTCGRTITLR